MMDYWKLILKKVSFDLKLFEKELLKALDTLVESEIQEFKNWCFENFEGKHQTVLIRCF